MVTWPLAEFLKVAQATIVFFVPEFFMVGLAVLSLTSAKKAK
jgi:hypothetical protein